MGHDGYPLALLRQVFVLAVCVRNREQQPEMDKLQRNELCALIDSAGWQTCCELQFTLKKIQPGCLLGTGQIEKIIEHIALAEEDIQESCDLADALDFVVVDYELSPTQLFNLEKSLKKPVIDRKALILVLFEQRAQTSEARLQVHLARLYYEKPRLKRAWTHLSRQRGGRYGTRGEGETQIEIDGRLIDGQIRKLEARITSVQKQRKQQRKRGAHLPHIALVGYTNAGKSALMQALCRQDANVADRLFATLDPKNRKLSLPTGEELIITDTVGFVRNLPHELINAFRATLEETVLADLQLLVLDVGDDEWREKLATVHQVLRELEVDEKAQILLLNKMDLLSEERHREMQALFPQALFVSAKEQLGLEALFAKLSERLAELEEEHSEPYSLEVPHEEGALRAWLFRQKVVSAELDITDSGQVFHIRLSGEDLRCLGEKFPRFFSQLEPLNLESLNLEPLDSESLNSELLNSELLNSEPLNSVALNPEHLNP
ncbi:GTPase HflX [Candidatus Haliotispira prima]|uniref:GTPase HflX n=1 Tax=Candidatus Haliotispira prima TaxID=3034016 RepID=A0ABY8MLE5_9SPIO|nr:GTPase HflX [Candidatus Haliotispira prima]